MSRKLYLGKMVTVRPSDPAGKHLKPCAAVVTRIHDEAKVDLTVFPGGAQPIFSLEGVLSFYALHQEHAIDGRYACWMWPDEV